MLQPVNGIVHDFKQYNDCKDNSNQRGALILKNIKFTSTQCCITIIILNYIILNWTQFFYITLAIILAAIM